MAEIGSEKKIRVLAAKPGLDCHDTGIIVICEALQQAGMETIYLGLWQTPESIVKAAIEEDVDVIAVSIMGGSPRYYLEEIMGLLKGNNAKNIPVVAGGYIPDEDMAALEEMGVTGLYGPGVSLKVIVDHIKEVAAERLKGMCKR
jgi:methylmalonyl-CoA mutase C-terminal domain/subunit